MILDERIGTHKYICPFCGKPRFLWDMYLGNKFEHRFWPDSRHEYLMMAKPSLIQKCDQCNHYYHISNAKYEYVSEDTIRRSIEDDIKAVEGANRIDNRTRISLQIEKLTEFKNALIEAKINRSGKLSVTQLYEAYDDIVSETASTDQIQDYLLMYIWAYNAPNAIQDDKINARALECAMKLIAIIGDNNPLAAELYRLFGQFEKSIEICKSILKAAIAPGVVEKILEKATLHQLDEVII